VVQLLAVGAPDSNHDAVQLPDDIAALLAEFPSVFQVPNSLPPKHACDHAIPLISGATPVNIRAYRYPPNLKDEIERQVNAMLSQGFIRPSKSPFSLPILLVRKNDGSWRFYVDYRYLNAMTVKYIYSIPVFDQLVDELGWPHGSQCSISIQGTIRSGCSPVKNIRRNSPLTRATLSFVSFRLVPPELSSFLGHHEYDTGAGTSPMCNSFL
jgi:hypothetical protein